MERQWIVLIVKATAVIAALVGDRARDSRGSGRNPESSIGDYLICDC
jgi:hypothetical protein